MKMKKYEKEKWESPRIVVEKFTTNDSINACYQVYCYTPDKNSWGYVFQDSNGNGHLDNQDAQIGDGALQGDGVSEYTTTYPANNGFFVKRSDYSRWYWSNGDYTGTTYPIFIYHGKKLPGEGHLSWHAADLSNPDNTNAVRRISNHS